VFLSFSNHFVFGFPQVFYFDETDNATTQTVRVMDKVVVQLSGNPTTGYKWANYYLEGNSLLQDGEPDFEKDGDVHHGKGGVFNFYYRGYESGMSVIRLVYAQHWNDFSPKTIYYMTVNVG